MSFERFFLQRGGPSEGGGLGEGVQTKLNGSNQPSFGFKLGLNQTPFGSKGGFKPTPPFGLKGGLIQTPLVQRGEGG